MFAVVNGIRGRDYRRRDLISVAQHTGDLRQLLARYTHTHMYIPT